MNATDLLPLEKAKLRMAYRIAEALAMQFNLGKTNWDQDEAAQTIKMLIPDSNAEIDEWCAKTFARPPEAGPSLIDQIRELMYCEKTAPLKYVLECVIAELKAGRP